MEANNVYDVGVIGAGIEGSAIAYTLSSLSGLRTVLIDQFPLPHTRGSSHGHSRGIRSVYGTEDFMTRMMKDAYPLWEDVERNSGQSIMKQTGLLHCDDDKKRMEETIACMVHHDIPHSVMTEQQVLRKWPGLCMSSGCQYLFDKTAGVLRANAALQAYQELFVRNGGTLRDSTAVHEVVPGSDVITLRTSRGPIRCRKVCLAAGPWTNKLLTGTGLTLPLTPQRISVLYWKLKEGKSMDGYPNFFRTSCETYSVSGDEYPGHVKVCPHAGPAVDPDLRDQGPADDAPIRTVQKLVADCLPYLDASGPSIVETCMYTMTPDADYILDRHPRHGNLYIAAGFSGHGFKMAPIVGQIMANMITGRASKYDLSHFRMNRFTDKSKL